MARLEFLLEEQSMKVVLEELLPKILPSYWVINHNIFLRPHEGKSDLRKSIPRKVRSFFYETEAVGVVILHDQDANECKDLKRDLLDLYNSALPQSDILPHLIRIVCRELEAWYLGDMDAIKYAYPKFQADHYKNKAKFRTPDFCNAKEELRKILPEFQQVTSARAIAPYLSAEKNRSTSFKQFVGGIQRFAAQLATIEEEE